MKKVFQARTLITPDEVVERAVMIVEDGAIGAIFSQHAQPLPLDGEIVDLGDAVLAPAFLDQHVHGGGGFDVMEATATALGGVGRFLAGHGLAAYLATTVTAPIEKTLASLSGLAALMGKRDGDSAGEAVLAGIHLEGPFLSHKKRGVHTPELLLTPSIELLDRFWQAAEGHVRLMTIAPELPNASEVIAHATTLGIRVSLGHSNATAADARTGIAAGAVSATHTFNAMRHFDHRDPGILGVVLDEDRLYAELICDGYHVDPSGVRLFWKAKDAERAILVTDSISATGMPDGTYLLGSLEVEVRDGKCMSDGAIAGSTLTMDLAVTNFHEFTGARLAEVVALAGRNPAKMLGLDDRLGMLAAGRSADFVVLSQDGTLRETVLAGVAVRI